MFWIKWSWYLVNNLQGFDGNLEIGTKFCIFAENKGLVSMTNLSRRNVG